MEPVSIEAAIEKAKKKGLRPGRVKGTDGIQFTKGRNDRIEVITWDEFRTTLADRKLEVYDSGVLLRSVVIEDKTGAFADTPQIEFGRGPCFWEVRADGAWSMQPRS